MKPSQLVDAGEWETIGTTAFRVVLALLVAPGVPALTMYLIGLFFASDWQAEFWPIVLAIAGYLAALAFGVPAYLLMRRKNIVSFKAYVVVGALIGLCSYALFLGLSFSYPEHSLQLLKNSLNLGIVATLYAVVASAVFWLIAIRNYARHPTQ